MKPIALLVTVVLFLGCTDAGRDPDQSTSRYDFLSLHWEATGSTNDARFCDLLGTGEKIPLESEVVLGIRHFAAAHATHDRARSVHSVDVELTPDGRRRLKEHSLENVGRRLAIVIDNDVVALPVVTRAIDKDTLDLMPIANARMAEDLAKRINAAIRGGNNGS